LKKRSNKTIAIYLIVIWIVAAFLLESSDLWISMSIYNPNLDWAILLEKYGEIPGLIVALIGIHIYIVTIKASSNIKTILITGFLLTVGSLVTIYILWLGALGISNQTIFFNSNRNIFFLIAIFSNILISYLFRKRYKFSKKSVLFSRVSFKMFFYGNIIFVFLLKILWGRIRFRDLSQDYSDFTTWYIPNGINGNQSFPSGHAAMGFMLLALFIFLGNKSLLIRIILKGLIFSWAIAVSISRVVVGAHYTSDIVFGSFIMIISYLLLIQNANKTLQAE
jgi:membrane-associated phospholipid phosphatase